MCREGKGERKRNVDQLPRISTWTRNQALSLGVCPDQEPQPQPFVVENDTRTEPPSQAHKFIF